MVVWWEHVLRYSRRDQLSLPFALRATGLHVAVHRLDNSLSELHEWPRGGVVHTRARPALPPGPEVIIAGLEDRVTQLEAREAELEARAERVEARAAELETLGAVALVERDALAARVESVEASLSWRLMRPARTAKRAARRLQGALADVARPASADDGG
jgi:hypothetical protein